MRQLFGAVLNFLLFLYSEEVDQTHVTPKFGRKVGGDLFQRGGHVVERGENLRQASDARAELEELVVHFAPCGGGGADVLRVFLQVLAQFANLLGVGDVLVRADAHAVLLVDESVHLGMRLIFHFQNNAYLCT